MSEAIAVDSSALIAILLGEPEAEQIEEALYAARAVAEMTAANLLETMMVVDARNPTSGITELRTVLAAYQIVIAPVTQTLTENAFRAWKRFGRGRHPARLNFGDCFAYALSDQLEAPLLFVGKDLAQTDVRSALR